VRRIFHLGLTLCAALTVAAVLWPADAEAQRARPRVRSSRPAVVVRAPHYRSSFYRPYYYRPYASYFGGAFFWQYPYGYPYPYPYYGYAHDDRSEIRIQSAPRDAEVYVDGYFAGLVDDFDGFAQRLRLEPGEHTITIYHPQHRPWREQVRVRPRQSMTVRPTLEPLPPGSQPEPRPTPSATAPAPYERGPESARRPAPRDRPAEEGPTGTLTLRVQPADAEVWVDGEKWDRPAGEDRLVIDLPEGSHRVEVRREGHRNYSTTVDVRRGERTMLNVSLPRGE
jgi:hypothetical protein